MTGDYLDMCNKCYSTIKDDLHAEERYDLFDGDEEELEDNNYLSNDMDDRLDMDR
jgi:hypothetical protein